jgi:hypothetical protein
MIAPTKFATALAIAALAIPVLAGAAEARRGVKPYYSETYETKGPGARLRRVSLPRLLLLLQALPQSGLQR